jgi:hypothetical protein
VRPAVVSIFHESGPGTLPATQGVAEGVPPERGDPRIRIILRSIDRIGSAIVSTLDTDLDGLKRRPADPRVDRVAPPARRRAAVSRPEDLFGIFSVMCVGTLIAEKVRRWWQRRLGFLECTPVCVTFVRCKCPLLAHPTWQFDALKWVERAAPRPTISCNRLIAKGCGRVTLLRHAGCSGYHRIAPSFVVTM